jgi:hypothetical protein
MTSPAVAVDGSDSTPRTAVGDGDAPGGAGANGPAVGAGDDAALLGGGTTDGAEGSGRPGATAGADWVVAGGVVAAGGVADAATFVCRAEIAPGAVRFNAAVNPTPRTTAARTPKSRGAAARRGPTGSSARQRGQNPETGVVVWPQFLQVTGRRAMP